MSATCIPSEVNLGRFWCGLLGMARSVARAWPPHRSRQVQRVRSLAQSRGGESRRTAALHVSACWPGSSLAAAKAATAAHKFSACAAWLELGRGGEGAYLLSGRLARAWPRRRRPHRSQHKFRACSAWLELGRGGNSQHRNCSALHRAWRGSSRQVAPPRRGAPPHAAASSVLGWLELGRRTAASTSSAQLLGPAQAQPAPHMHHFCTGSSPV